MNSFRTKIIASAAAIMVLAAFPAAAQQQDGLSLPGAGQASPPRASLPAGASVSGAGEQVREMSSQAGRTLDELICTAVSPHSATEIGELSNRQRRIIELEFQVKEAELARQLWEILNGDQEGMSSDDMERLAAENEALQSELARMRIEMSRSAPAAAPEPDPVVAEITGAGGSVRARILVPYRGEVMATSGTTLPNGMRVTGISASGVTVQTEGGSRTLPFGQSVPSVRPPAVQPQAASSQDMPGMLQIGR